MELLPRQYVAIITSKLSDFEGDKNELYFNKEIKIHKPVNHM